MMSGSDTVLFSLYVCLLGVLSLFAVHRLRLALAAGRMQKVRAVPPPEWPRVLVQLPLYNERYVAERLIDAVAALDYPADRLSIQVLDDSTDDTTAVVAGCVAALRTVPRHLLYNNCRCCFCGIPFEYPLHSPPRMQHRLPFAPLPRRPR